MRKISALTHISAFCWTGGSGEEMEGRWGCGGVKADTESEMEHVAYRENSSLMTALVCVSPKRREMWREIFLLWVTVEISKSATDESKLSVCTKADSDATLSSIVSSLILASWIIEPCEMSLGRGEEKQGGHRLWCWWLSIRQQESLPPRTGPGVAFSALIRLMPL